MLDPHNLWVYNSSKPATAELPGGASMTDGKYTPEANITESQYLSIAANSTKEVVDSYIKDTFINDKLNSSEVRLTADGNITLVSNVTIKSISSNKLYIVAAKEQKTGSTGFQTAVPNTGNIVINNATVDISGDFTLIAQGKVNTTNSKLITKVELNVSTSEQITVNNSSFSGTKTILYSERGNVDITSSVLNGTTSVVITSPATRGNTSLKSVTVNTQDLSIHGTDITLDNATLNVTPQSTDQCIKIGLGREVEISLGGNLPKRKVTLAPAKTVVIKNSTLNTTGSTAGVIKVQGIEEHSSFLSCLPHPPPCFAFHSQ